MWFTGLPLHQSPIWESRFAEWWFISNQNTCTAPTATSFKHSTDCNMGMHDQTANWVMQAKIDVWWNNASLTCGLPHDDHCFADKVMICVTHLATCVYSQALLAWPNPNVIDINLSSDYQWSFISLISQSSITWWAMFARWQAHVHVLSIHV